MSRLTWGAVGERFYETGVDRGVLYIAGSPGVVWNGLISVSESTSGGEAKPYYIDGVKYLNRPSSSEFEATIEAYTYPEEFAQCDGTTRIGNGLSATNQNRKLFGLCYRNQIGNDLEGTAHAYKIHLVYGALAAPTQQSHATMSDSPEAFNFSWDVTTQPPMVEGYRPTAHYVVSSKDTPEELLALIEDILYGTSTQAPRLPSAEELVSLFENYSGAYDGGVYNAPYYSTLDGGTPPEVYDFTVDSENV